MSEELVRLTISRHPEGFEFCLQEPGGRQLAALGCLEPGRWEPLASTLGSLRSTLAASPWREPPPEASARLSACREALGGLFPAAVRLRLSDLDAQPLALHIDGDLPWELGDVGGTPLCFCCSCGRWDEPSSGSSMMLPAGALLVSDPDGTLPGSSREADALAEVLGNRMSVHRLRGGEATRSALTQRLEREAPYVMVVTGHVAFSDAGRLGVGSRLVLADGVMDLGALESLTRVAPPQLVFLNLLVYGPCPSPLGPFPWAEAFLQAGSRSVVLNQWNAAGVGSIYLKTLDRMAAGEAVGLALRNAREEFRQGNSEDLYCSAFSPLLFGDPRTVLPQALGRSVTVGTALRAEFNIRVSDGPDAGLEFPLFAQALDSGRSVFVGSPGVRVNEVEIEDDSLDNRMVRLQRDGDGLRLVNLTGDRSRVRVNRLPVGESVLLEGGETWEMGDTVIRFERAGDPAPKTAAARPQRCYGLRVVKGGQQDQGKEILLGGGLTIVGRLPECSLQLHDAAVSRQHFTIVDRDGTFSLTHVGTNPTVVNGVAVRGERELGPGDRIQLSDRTVLEFLERKVEG